MAADKARCILQATSNGGTKMIRLSQMMLTALLVTAAMALQAGQSVETAAPNTWVEIPDSQMKKVAYPFEKNPKVDGVCGSGSVIAAWCGAAFDSKRDRLVLWGGGHADYAGNELYGFDVKKLAWERITEPFPDPVKDQEINADGSPNSRHTYAGSTYIAHADRFFSIGGSLWGVGFAKCDLTWTFDFEAKKWENRNPSGANDLGGFEQSSIYDPATKLVYYFNGKGFYTYDYDKNAWSRLGEGLYATSLTIDTKRNLLFAIGSGKVLVYDLHSQKPKSQEWKTTGGDEFIAKSKQPLDYSPVADRIVGWDGAGKIYVLDPDKKVWSVQDAAGGPQATPNGMYGRFHYVPSLNAFICVTDMSANVFFYKFSAGSGTSGNSNGSPAEKPAPKPAPVVKVVKPARDLSAQREALKACLKKASATAKLAAKMTIFGKSESVLFAGADADGIKVTLEGNTLPVRWKDVQDADLARLVFAGFPQDADALYNAGIVAFESHQENLYGSIVANLTKIDAGRVSSLLDSCNAK
jgi:hypothetical protein